MQNSADSCQAAHSLLRLSSFQTALHPVCEARSENSHACRTAQGCTHYTTHKTTTKPRTCNNYTTKTSCAACTCLLGPARGCQTVSGSLCSSCVTQATLLGCRRLPRPFSFPSIHNCNTQPWRVQSRQQKGLPLAVLLDLAVLRDTMSGWCCRPLQEHVSTALCIHHPLHRIL